MKTLQSKPPAECTSWSVSDKVVITIDPSQLEKVWPYNVCNIHLTIEEATVLMNEIAETITDLNNANQNGGHNETQDYKPL